MKSKEPVSCADMIVNVFSNIEKRSVEGSMKLVDVWRGVVQHINENSSSEQSRNYGEQLAAHTRVIDLKDGILLVETDHPGWIQILQIYSKYIITGLNRKLPELKIKSLAYRLEGSSAQLYGADYGKTLQKEREKLSQKLDQEEAEIQKFSKSESPASDKTLPDDLKAKFDSIRQSMLTNSNK